jgi:hypothetical protein
VLPGFVTLLIRERAYTVPTEKTPFERLLNALYYSTLVYALTLAVALAVGFRKHDVVALFRGQQALGATFGVALVIGLVVPAVIAEAGLLWRNSDRRPRVLEKLGVSPAHDVDSGWNQAFSSISAAFVRVTTHDGRVIGGAYGRGSLAGYSEQAHDLYLRQRYELDDDDWFNAPAPRTLGVWIPKENIASVEFYRLGPDAGEDVTTNA